MDRREVEIVSLTAIGGGLLSILSVLYFERLPVVPLAGKYLVLQAVLFYVLGGTAFSFVLRSRTTYMRLLGLYVVVSVIFTVGGLLTLKQPVPILTEGIGLLMLSGAAAEGVRRKYRTDEMILQLFALLLSVLVSFAVIFLLISFQVSGNPTLLAPMLIAAVLYIVSTGVIRNEKSAY